MSSAEHKRFGPLVDDGCSPVEVDLFSQDDVDYLPLATLYERTCQRLQTKVNSEVLRQLPTTARHHYRLGILDCSNTYLGNLGAAALVPVVAACIRMTHLIIPRCGMKAPAALALLRVIAAHPGLHVINLAHNDLGTVVGNKLLRLVHEHQRIYEINLTETLIIQPIKRKIEAQLANNFAIRDTFQLPLVPSHPDDEDVKQQRRRQEEERARVVRDAELRKEMEERIPVWAPAVLVQLSEILHKYRHQMESVFILFHTDNVHARFVSPRSFARAMRVAGVKAFEDVACAEARATEFADLFGAWRRSENDIDHMVIVDALRQHAVFSVDGLQLADDMSTDVAAIPRQIIDRLYDAREILMSSFESVDVDDTKHVSAHEMVVGIESIVAGCASSLVIAAAVRSIVSLFAHELQGRANADDFDSVAISVSVDYVGFVTRLKCSDQPLQERDWIVKRSDLRALVCV